MSWFDKAMANAGVDKRDDYGQQAIEREQNAKQEQADYDTAWNYIKHGDVSGFADYSNRNLNYRDIPFLGQFVGHAADAATQGIADLAQFTGAEGVGNYLNDAAKRGEERLPPMSKPELSLNYITDPNGLASAFGSVTGSMLPIGAAAYLAPVGGVTAAAANVGSKVPFIGGLLGQSLPHAIRWGLTGPVEGAMEAGGAERDMLEQGMSREEARQKSWEVFGKNAALLAATNAIGGAALPHIFKGVTKAAQNGSRLAGAGRFAGATGTEVGINALEEGEQQGIQNSVMGKPYSYNPANWSEDQKEAAEFGVAGTAPFALFGLPATIRGMRNSSSDPLRNDSLEQAQAILNQQNQVQPAMSVQEAQGRIFDEAGMQKILNQVFNDTYNQSDQFAESQPAPTISAENSLDGFDNRYVSKWESKPGATDLAGVQQSVKNAFNAAIAEYGDGVTLTGGAEKGYHATGAEGHEGGWKIDVDKASVKDPQKFLQAMARHGFKVGDEGDHYDLSGHAKGGVGGTVVATPDSFISNGGQSSQATGRREGHANAWAIYDVFKNAGYSDEAIAGILGRAQQEHNFSTDMAEEKDVEGIGRVGGFGMFQWQMDPEYGGRGNAFMQWAQENNLDPNNATVQAQYALIEAQQRGLTPERMNQLTAEEAADLWTDEWEVGKRGDERKYAAEWRDRIKNGGSAGGSTDIDIPNTKIDTTAEDRQLAEDNKVWDELAQNGIEAPFKTEQPTQKELVQQAKDAAIESGDMDEVQRINSAERSGNKEELAKIADKALKAKQKEVKGKSAPATPEIKMATPNLIKQVKDLAASGKQQGAPINEALVNNALERGQERELQDLVGILQGVINTHGFEDRKAKGKELLDYADNNGIDLAPSLRAGLVKGYPKAIEAGQSVVNKANAQTQPNTPVSQPTVSKQEQVQPQPAQTPVQVQPTQNEQLTLQDRVNQVRGNEPGTPVNGVKVSELASIINGAGSQQQAPIQEPKQAETTPAAETAPVDEDYHGAFRDKSWTTEKKARQSLAEKVNPFGDAEGFRTVKSLMERWAENDESSKSERKGRSYYVHGNKVGKYAYDYYNHLVNIGYGKRRTFSDLEKEMGVKGPKALTKAIENDYRPEKGENAIVHSNGKKFYLNDKAYNDFSNAYETRESEKQKSAKDLVKQMMEADERSINKHKRASKAATFIRTLLEKSGIKVVSDRNEMEKLGLGVQKGGKLLTNLHAANVKENTIYIDFDHIDEMMQVGSPLHEYTHIWDALIAKRNPELWKRGVELMKQTPEWESVKKRYLQFGFDYVNNEYGLATEVHAALSEKYGSDLFIGNGEDDGSSLVNQLVKWAKDYWRKVKDMLSPWTTNDAQNMSLEDFINAPIATLLDEKNLFAENEQPEPAPKQESAKEQKVPAASTEGNYPELKKSEREHWEGIAKNASPAMMKMYGESAVERAEKEGVKIDENLAEDAKSGNPEAIAYVSQLVWEHSMKNFDKLPKVEPKSKEVDPAKAYDNLKQLYKDITHKKQLGSDWGSYALRKAVEQGYTLSDDKKAIVSPEGKRYELSGKAIEEFRLRQRDAEDNERENVDKSGDKSAESQKSADNELSQQDNGGKIEVETEESPKQENKLQRMRRGREELEAVAKKYEDGEITQSEAYSQVTKIAKEIATVPKEGVPNATFIDGKMKQELTDYGDRLIDEAAEAAEKSEAGKSKFKEISDILSKYEKGEKNLIPIADLMKQVHNSKTLSQEHMKALDERAAKIAEKSAKTAETKQEKPAEAENNTVEAPEQMSEDELEDWLLHANEKDIEQWAKTTHYKKVAQSGSTFIIDTFYNTENGKEFTICVRDYDYDGSRDINVLYEMPIDKDAYKAWQHKHGKIVEGDVVEVVKGRKVPVGTISRVKKIRSVRDKYGRWVADYADLENGQSTNVTNCQRVEEAREESGRIFKDTKTADEEMLEGLGLNDEAFDDIDVKGVTNIDDEIDNLTKELTRELSKLNANPVFNPRVYTVGLKLAILLTKKGYNNVKKLVAELNARFGKDIEPWSESIIETVRTWPKGVPFDERQVMVVSQAIGARYEDGITSLDDVQADMKKKLKKHHARFAPMIEASYNGISKFFESRKEGVSNETDSGRTGDESKRSEGTETVPAGTERGAESVSERERGSEGTDRGLETSPAENGQEVSENGNPEGVRAGVSGETGRQSNAPEGRADGHVGRESGSESESSPMGRGGRQSSREGSSGSSRVGGVREETSSPLTNAENYHIDDMNALFGGTPKVRFARNRKAIEVFQDLQATKRVPTQEEKDAMAAYTGWGSFGQQLFQGTYENPKPAKGWEEESEWLRDTLGKEDWESAKDSIINAHYTAPVIVKAMWDMARRMGFKNGRVLEPSMGVGNFFGLMPKDMEQGSSLFGVEMDNTTGGMAKMLYPQANIQIKPYQDVHVADGTYDLIVGNVPFGDIAPADRRYDKFRPNLHDYFFLKGIDELRSGGIMMAITSKGTMDKMNRGVRMELAKKAELVDAYRFPTGAFGEYAGTDVVTDVLIFKKREEPIMDVSGEDWIGTTEHKSDKYDYNNHEYYTYRVNNFFENHPEKVLGTMGFGRSTGKRPGLMVTMNPETFQKQLDDMVKHVTKDAYEEAHYDKNLQYVSNNENDRIGTLQEVDGKLYVATGVDSKPIEAFKEWSLGGNITSTKTINERLEELKDLVKLRKAYAKLEDAEKNDSPDMEKLRKQLKSVYDAHVAKYCTDKNGKPQTVTYTDYDENGNKVKKKRPKLLEDTAGLKLFKKADEPNYFSLCALQRKDGKPAKILTERVMRTSKKDIKNPTLQEALMIQRNQSMRIDIDEIAKMAKKSKEEVISGLREYLFKTPNGDYQVKDQYLSGNVRRKLREAQNAYANGDKDMKHNIEALQKVMPEDIPYYNISVSFGGTWIDLPYYKQFIAELVGTNNTDKIDITRDKSGSWRVRFEDSSLNGTAGATTTYGTPDVKFDRLLTHALNHTKPTINRTDPDGTRYKDEAAIEKAVEQMDKIRETFADWVWQEEKRKVALAHNYNEIMNNTARPTYDGSFLDMAGMMLTKGDKEFNLRKHQINAIYRGLVNGSGIYAHEVGTGKTYTMGGLAMESRRFGVAKKPLILAHNANSQTVANDIQAMYPGAKVLYIAGDTKNVKKDLMRVKMDDWDVIVMPHSKTNLLTLKTETLDAMAADIIAELEDDAMEAAKADGVDLSKYDLDDEKDIKKIRSQTAKDLVKQRLRIKEQIRKYAFKASDKEAIPFEDLGIDMIIVDESHDYKKPPFSTKMSVKGLQKGVSGASVQLSFLTQYVQGLNNGKGVHLFTGTPITNTITEMYHNMRYVMPNEMKEAGVYNFDDWFNAFANVTSNMEYTSTGEVDNVDRLNAFVNVAELRRMVGQYMDIVFAEDMPEFKPRETASGKTLADKDLTAEERDYLINGRDENAVGRPYMQTINEVIPMNDAQKSILSMFMGYAKDWKKANKKQRKHIMLESLPQSPLYTESSTHKAAMDARMFNPNINVSGMDSKEARVIKNVVDVYKKDKRATQVIMMDQGKSDSSVQIPRDDRGYPIAKKDAEGRTIKEEVQTYNLQKGIIDGLIKQGIPEKEIAVVTGTTSPDKKAEIANAVKHGEIRVVIGSTATLGTGVNMQDNLKAIHHIDAPWMPGDLEQRNGRILRQGNKWNTVLEYRYITEKLDGRRWQVLSTKKKFIKMFMKADDDLRVLDGDAVDVSSEEEASGGDFEETLSKATGDPRFLRKANLEETVKKLEKSRAAFVAGIEDAKFRLQKLKEGGLDELRDNVRALTAIQDKYGKYKQTHADSFEITIDGKRYTKTTDANEAIATAFRNSDKIGKEFKLGEYAGLNLYGIKQRNTDFTASYTNRIRITDSDKTIPGFDCADSTGGINQKLANVGRAIDREQNKLDMAESDIKTLEKQIKGTFPREAVLNAKQKELEALKQDLIDNPVPPPQWLVEGAPMQADVIVDGKRGTVESYRVVGETTFEQNEDGEVQQMTATDEEHSSFYVGVKLDGSDTVRLYPWQKVMDNQGLPMITAPEGVSESEDLKDNEVRPAETKETKAEEPAKEEKPQAKEESKPELAEESPVVQEYKDKVDKILEGAKKTGITSRYVTRIQQLIGDIEQRRLYYKDLSNEDAAATKEYANNALAELKQEPVSDHILVGTVPPAGKSTANVNVDEFEHTKTGKMIPAASLKDHVDKDFRKQATTIAKNHGGKWSPFAKRILFKTEQGRDDFVREVEALLSVTNPESSGAIEVKFSQEGWHGSKYHFDKFDVTKIGTGEGAQAHGYGLYIAGNKEVAEGYRDRLSPNEHEVVVNGETYFFNKDGDYENSKTGEILDSRTPLDTAVRYFAESEGDYKQAIKTIKKQIEEEAPNKSSLGEEIWNRLMDYLNKPLEILEKDGASWKYSGTKGGKLYQVEIPDSDVLLDEQKEFSEQPKKVQKALRKLISESETAKKHSAWAEQIYESNGKKIYGIVTGIAEGDAPRNANFDNTQRLGSELLNKYGIKGITYEGGRDGRCFVIFDDQAIEIINKFSAEGEIRRAVERAVPVANEDLTPQQLKMSEFGKEMGTPILWISTDPNLHGFHAPNGTTVLNVRSNMDLSKTFWHEVFHWVAGNNEELYNELLDYFKGKSAFSKKQLEAYRKRIGRPGISDELAIEEMLADNFEEVKDRVKIFKEMGAKQPSLARKFVAWVKRIMDKFAEFFHNPEGKLTTAQRDSFVKAFGRLARDIKDGNGRPLFKVHKEGKEIKLPDGGKLAAEGIKLSSNTKYSYGPSDNSNESLFHRIKNIMAGKGSEDSEKFRYRKHLTEMIEKALDVKLRYGKMEGNKSQVVYKPEDRVLRSRHAFDWENILPVAGRIAAERLGIEPTESMNNYIADWILTGAPNNVSKEADTFHKAMRQHPAESAKMEDLRDAFAEWLGKDYREQMQGTIQWRNKQKPTMQERKNKLYEEFVEELEPINRMVKQVNANLTEKGQKKLGITADPMVAFRMLRGSYGRAMVALEGRNDGAVDALKHAFPNVDFTGFKTLYQILKSIDAFQDADKQRDFITYCTACHIMDMHQHNDDIRQEQQHLKNKIEKLGTGKEDEKKKEEYEADIEKLSNELMPIPAAYSKDNCQKYINDGYDKYHAAQQDLVHFSNTTAAMLADSGVISEKRFQELLTKWQNYVPLFRVFEDNEDINFGDSMKHIKGSTRDIVNPLESIIRNTAQFIQKAELNKAKCLLADVARCDASGWLLEEVDKSDSDKTTITFWENGKRKYLQTDPDIVRAVNNMGADGSHFFIKFLHAITRLARACFTMASPEFALRNVARDWQDATLYTKHGMWVNPLDIIRGFLHAWRHDDVYYEWLTQGAAQASALSLDRDYTQSTLDKLGRGYWKRLTSRDWYNALLEGLQMAGEYSEYGTRIAMYKKTKAAILKDKPNATAQELQEAMLEAAFESRDLMDFARHGKAGAEYNKITAFANASIQGWDKLYRSLDFKSDPKRATRVAAKLVLYGALPAMMIFAMYHDDDWYKDAPNWLKETHWLFKFGDTTIRIPKAADMGIRFISNAVEKGLDEAYNKHPHKAKEYFLPMWDALPGMLPTSILPIIEIQANHSFFTDRPIIPQGQDKLPAKLQYGPYTTSLAKWIGETFDIAPRSVEHFISGYTGTLGMAIPKAIDLVSGANQQSLSLEEMPLIRGYLYPQFKSPQSVSDYYEKLNEQTKLKNEYKLTHKRPDGFDPALLQRLENAQKQLRKISKQEKSIIDNPKWSIHDKEVMQRNIQKKRIEIAKRALGTK